MYSILKKHRLSYLIIFAVLIFSGNFYLEKKIESKNPYECNSYQDFFNTGYKKINSQEYYVVFCKILSYDRDSEEIRIMVFTGDKKKLLVKRYYTLNWGGANVFWEKDKLLYYSENHDEGVINFPPTWWDWFRANYL